MADKPEFVDMISEATRQNPRRYASIVDLHAVKKASRLARTPSSLVQWRLETFTPWKIKSWKTGE